ncbi:MAG: transporter substrate-binding domain-containing protein [Pseudomonadota bacterium]
MHRYRLPRMLAALAAVLLIPGHAGAREEPAGALRLIGGETAFYCFSASNPNEGGSAGMACEIVKEMARRVGYTGTFETYPLARALVMAANSPGILLAPVGRVAARENLYSWQVAIFEDDFVAVTRRDAAIDITSIEALRELNIGVVRDGAAAHLAKEKDLSHLSLVANDDTNAKKLHAGRIDAWISTWNGIRAAQRAGGFGIDSLRRGVVLARVKAYLVSSRDLPPAVVAPWKAAFDEMVRDGSYEAILRKYQFETPR